MCSVNGQQGDGRLVVRKLRRIEVVTPDSGHIVPKTVRGFDMTVGYETGGEHRQVPATHRQSHLGPLRIPEPQLEN